MDIVENMLPACARGEGVITAKCQTVGISKDRYHPAFSTYRPSMDIKKGTCWVPFFIPATGQIYLGYNFWRYRKTSVINL
jgi:hypothetical protein